jgi:gliding-associated putative ABC transporter substrate-binding component GldG
MKKTSYLTSILLLFAIFIVVAVISEKYFFRIDLTEGKQYSLSDATKNILKNIKEPTTVTAYFTGDLAPDLDKVKRNFQDLLVEYNSVSGGNVVYKFVDPNSDEKIEREAQQAGVRPVLFKAREKDELKQQKVYLGAVIKMGDQTDVIPFINPQGSIEYDLSTAIKKISVKNKPLIGFVQGQGEPPISAYQQVMGELNVLYNVKSLYLSDTMKNLAQYKTMVISAPKDSFNIEQLNVLDKYLSQGGKLFIAMNRVEGNLQTMQGTAVNTGLETWLEEKGIKVDKDFVIDANCSNIGVSQQNGQFSMTTPVRFPYLPIITNFSDNPITKGLEQVMLNFTSPITFVGDTSLHFVPLALTSEKSGEEAVPVYFNIQKRWLESDFNQKNLVVAALLQGKINNNPDAKIIVVSNGDFAVNGEGQRPRQVQPDNVSLMANSIDWLSDDTGLIDLRTKTITSRPIDQMSDSKALLLKWLNFLLPLLLVIIYGIARMQFRRIQKLKRMEEGYVK